jgi:hypothetical protein
MDKREIQEQGFNKIKFDKEKYFFLKRVVNIARRKNEKDFLFEGVFFLTEYAEEVLQGLKIHFEEQ